MKKEHILLVYILSIKFFLINSHSYPLENWRSIFYKMAVEQGEVFSSSSKMFWDNMPAVPIFDSTLLLNSAQNHENYWTLEPALTEKISNRKYLSKKKANLHFDMRSDFKYKNFLIRTVLDVDQENKYNTEYPWHKIRMAAGRIEEAYLQYSGKSGFLRLGRLNRNWGPFFDRSILLSNNPYSYDAFEWQFSISFLEFRHLFTAFPKIYSHMDTDNKITINRYFSAHVLNFIFGRWASIGIAETVLFTKNDGFPDIQYLNPFSIYTVINTNQEGPANLMLGFHGWVHPFTSKITLKGQVVFDDIQVDDKDVGDQEPLHWACDFGLYWVEPLPIKPNHHFAFEYRYLSKWMYTVNRGNTLNGERYTYLGKSLGVQNIDGDLVKGIFTLIGKNFWAGSIGLCLTRQDTNTIHRLWPQDYLKYTKEDPLSKRAKLKTTFEILLELHGYFKNYCDMHLSFRPRWIKDKGINNNFKPDPVVSLWISLHYSNFFIKFEK